MGNELLTLYNNAKQDLPDKVFDLGDRIAVINRGYNVSRNIDDGKILLFDVTHFHYPILDDSEQGILLEKGFARGTAILQRLKTERLLEHLELKKRVAMEANNSSKVKSLNRQRKKLLNKIETIKKYLQLSEKTYNFEAS